MASLLGALPAVVAALENRHKGAGNGALRFAPLSHAILDLDNEMRGAGDAGSCALWVDLIERYVSRFAEPWRGEERLFMVWDTVGRDLARPWTLKQLAAIARTSSEHLRRL